MPTDPYGTGGAPLGGPTLRGVSPTRERRCLTLLLYTCYHVSLLFHFTLSLSLFLLIMLLSSLSLGCHYEVQNQWAGRPKAVRLFLSVALEDRGDLCRAETRFRVGGTSFARRTPSRCSSRKHSHPRRAPVRRKRLEAKRVGLDFWFFFFGPLL